MNIDFTSLNNLNFYTGLSLVGLGILAFLMSWRLGRTNPEAKRLQTFVERPIEQPLLWQETDQVRRRELRGSFGSRVVTPAFRWFGSILGRFTPGRTIQNLEHQLFIAGFPLGLHAREFYGLRLAFMILGFYLGYRLLIQEITLNNAIIVAMVLILTTYIPKSWLTSMVNRRKSRIRKGLPDALDMLSVCADAGLGFDQSLQRVSDYWHTPLGLELGRVVSEMEMGVSRSESLRNLANRFDVDELSSFVAVIVQSDQMGMSIADTLNGQAKQMRIERRYRAMEQARKIPLKMLFPMLLLILPAMLAVVLGPSIPALQDMFDAMLSATR